MFSFSFISFLFCLSFFGFGSGLVSKDAIAKPNAQTMDSNDDYYLVDSCSDLEDGEYYMKLFESDSSIDENEDYPIVKVKCSNGYMIIDVSYDSNMISYFTSWAMWHSEIGGPTNADIVDWTSWFLKTREDPENAEFVLSPDCNTCDDTNVRQHFGKKSTYWMSGNLFGCFWMILGKHNCDLDKDTYGCYDCSASTNPEENGAAELITDESDPWKYYFTGQCATAIRASNSEVTSSHDTCQLGMDWVWANTAASMWEKEYETNVVSQTKSTAMETFETLLESDDITSFAWDASKFVGEIFKPSIGTDGRFCVCQTTSKNNFISVTKDELQSAMDTFGDSINTFHQFNSFNEKKSLKEENKNENKNENENENRKLLDIEFEENTKIVSPKEKKTSTIEEKTPTNNKIELYNDDFKDGTYRITESGTYVIMENIEFEFNAGSLDDPQGSEAWKPKASQVNDYAGAQSGRDEYFLGFFAGITIECDNVVLDLNGFELSMSEVFYHQQRWFTIISLTSQFFLPGNGPGFFGYDPKSASNVIIKNGIIGLSSHFGIHGNYNNDIYIENIHVKNFEVHGIQFNGFDNLQMTNIEVGPSSTMSYLTGEYGHMRYILDRLNNAIEDLGDDSDDAIMNWYGRKSESLKELSERLERMMNYGFNYVVKNERLNRADFESAKDYKEYLDSIDIFVNPSGIPYASVMHGIFLNTKEASVMTYNLYTTTYSENAVLNNVKIHDLQHSFDERVRVFADLYMIFGPFLNSISARQLVGDEIVDNSDIWPSNDCKTCNYKGSIVTDVYMALTKYSNNWDYLEKTLFGVHVLVPWSEGKIAFPNNLNIACNMDVMIHSGKGTIGLRLDGVKDISVNNLEIYNLHDSTPQGEAVCGEYESFDPTVGGGHLAQQQPMQTGFSGNKVQAVTFNSAFGVSLEDVTIHDLESETGPVTGLTIWPANEITLNGNFNFYNFESSSKVSSDNEYYGIAPNQDHHSCAVYVYEKYYKSASDTTYESTVTLNHDSINACNINSIDWENDCYDYSDSVGTGSSTDASDDMVSFLSMSNNNKDECDNDNDNDSIIIKKGKEKEKQLNNENENENNVNIFSNKNNSNNKNTSNWILYSGIAFAILSIIGIIVAALYCRQNVNGHKHDNSSIIYSQITNNYGSL